MENKKSKYLIGSIICGLLTVTGYVSSVVSLVEGQYIIRDLIILAISMLIGFYTVSGYKKPHGNLLKYIILSNVAIFLCAIYDGVSLGLLWAVMLFALTIGLVCYVAGRLHKIQQNKMLMALITVCYAIALLIGKGSLTIGVFGGVVVWIDVCVAYFLRFKEHKESGLIDAQ